MTHRRTWQKLESKVAGLLGGERRKGIYQPGEDVIHGQFAIECKYRAKIAFLDWFRQAESYAAGTDKIPLLVVKQKNTSGEFAIMRLADFNDLLKLNKSV